MDTGQQAEFLCSNSFNFANVCNFDKQINTLISSISNEMQDILNPQRTAEYYIKDHCELFEEFLNRLATLRQAVHTELVDIEQHMHTAAIAYYCKRLKKNLCHKVSIMDRLKSAWKNFIDYIKAVDKLKYNIIKY